MGVPLAKASGPALRFNSALGRASLACGVSAAIRHAKRGWEYDQRYSGQMINEWNVQVKEVVSPNNPLQIKPGLRQLCLRPYTVLRHQMLQCYHHIPTLSSGINVLVRICDPFERKTSIDVRLELSFLG